MYIHLCGNRISVSIVFVHFWYSYIAFAMHSRTDTKFMTEPNFAITPNKKYEYTLYAHSLDAYKYIYVRDAYP